MSANFPNKSALALRALYRRLHESMTPEEKADLQVAIDCLEELQMAARHVLDDGFEGHDLLAAAIDRVEGNQ